MSRLFRKLVIVLVLVIAILQIVHISLMSRFEKRKKEIDAQNKVARAGIYGAEQVAHDRLQMYRSLQSLSSVLDSSGEYCIVDFFMAANKFKKKYVIMKKSDTVHGLGWARNGLYRRADLSVATHGSLSQLKHLPALADRWQGLLSVSLLVLTQRQLPIAVETILLMRFCKTSIRHRMSFHLVYPLALFPQFDRRQSAGVPESPNWSNGLFDSYLDYNGFIKEDHCNQIDLHIAKITEDSQVNYDYQVPYPNNLLRNIARRYALTEYSLVIDIDLLPSAGLYENFLEFGQRTKLFKPWDPLSEPRNQYENKIVFVVPTYEIDLTLARAAHSAQNDDPNSIDLIPRDKQQLIEAIDRQYVRPFYVELCWKCHKYTNYDTWLHAARVSVAKNNSTGDGVPGPLNTLFEVMWHDPWEPFYISSNSVPLYDERFRQYGFNRISQVCELHIAGYRFAVLDNAFLVHKGFKTAHKFHPGKDAELEHNRMLFRQFKLQLKDRYSSSNRRC